MVLSCSLRDFLSPLGMEIRLGLCKRIFYFSFFPPLLFFHVRCPGWPFRKSNLDFFFSLTTAFFSLFAVTQNTDVCPMDFSSGEFWKCSFFRLEEEENHGFHLHLPFGPAQQKFNIEMKTYPWTLAAFNMKMDNYQLEDWWVSWRSSCDLISACFDSTIVWLFIALPIKL